MTTAKHYEIQFNKDGSKSYLFSKRLNPKQGRFPRFKDKVKKKLGAFTEAEAVAEAMGYSNDLGQLQQVCLRDSKGHIVPLKDMNKAADAWFDLVLNLNLQDTLELKLRKTKDGLDAQEYLDFLKGEVADEFSEREETHRHDEPFRQWLTPFGDLLMSRLGGAVSSYPLSSAAAIYFKQTQRDHLPPESKQVRDINRPVMNFIQLLGDKPLTSITRADVERFITSRLDQVKTTTVQREVTSLRALWTKCSLSLDIRQQNPFSEQPIKGLGTDSVERITPSVAETHELIEMLKERHKKLPKSYISPLVMVAVLSGLRLNEAWGIEPEDYAPAKLSERFGVIYIRKNNTRKNLKNKNSIRPFPVLPELHLWLTVLFEVKRPKNSNSASGAILSALKKKGIKFGTHSLRHGFKQRLTELDAPLDTIDELCGWSAQRSQNLYGYRTVNERKARLVHTVYELLMPSAIRDNVIAFPSRQIKKGYDIERP